MPDCLIHRNCEMRNACGFKPHLGEMCYAATDNSYMRGVAQTSTACDRCTMSVGHQRPVTGRAVSRRMLKREQACVAISKLRKHQFGEEGREGISRPSLQNSGALCPFLTPVTSSLATTLRRGSFKKFNSSIVHTVLLHMYNVMIQQLYTLLSGH